MTWRNGEPGWEQQTVPVEETNFFPLFVGLTGADAATGPWSIIMACLIRYAGLRVVVELGTYRGATTTCLADAVKSTGGLCVTIDQEQCQIARDRVANLGLAEQVIFFQKKTGEVNWEGDPIDLLFIDAGHSYEEFTQDWQVWSPRVRPGGWVFIDNITSEAGVSRGMHDLLSSVEFLRAWEYVLCPSRWGMAILHKRNDATMSKVFAMLKSLPRSQRAEQ